MGTRRVGQVALGGQAAFRCQTRQKLACTECAGECPNAVDYLTSTFRLEFLRGSSENHGLYLTQIFVNFVSVWHFVRKLSYFTCCVVETNRSDVYRSSY